MTTFVLIHGAYQGGWIWKPVATRLRAEGHEVHAPSLDGCGERAGQIRPGITTESQADEIVRLLFFEDLSEVVLVGTSSGGMVLARVAEQARERISRLVFVDALALRDGEKIRDIVTRPAAIETEIAVGPARDDPDKPPYPGLDPALLAFAAPRCTLHPAAVFHQPVRLESFWSQSWDAAVVFCRQARNPGEAHQRRCAETLNARWYELDTGHYPMLSAPDALTRVILSG